MYTGKKKDYFLVKRAEFVFTSPWNFSKMLGFSTFNYFVFKKRLECHFNCDYDLFVSIVKKRIPLNFFFFKRYIYNIFLLDLISSYRGLRHCLGLPTRGQRTWTNAVSSYKSNTHLRHFKIYYFKRFLGTVNSTLASQSFMAEQVNLLWKIQWECEWREARKKHKKIMHDKKNTNLQVDLQSMAKGDISGYTKRGAASKKKIYKQKKNQFTLGFDIGFTQQIESSNSSYVITK